MKKPRSKTSKTVHKKRTEFKKMYEKRMRAELELRSVTEKLRRAHEWLPLLAVEQPRKKPAAVLKALRKRHSKLLGIIKEFQQKGIGELPWRKPLPDGRRAELPDKEEMKQAAIGKGYVDALRAKTGKTYTNTCEQFYYLPPRLEDLPNRRHGIRDMSDLAVQCPAWIDVRQSNNLIKYPTDLEFPPDSEGNTSGGDFDLEVPGILWGKINYDGWITKIAGEGFFPYAYLSKFAALEFKIPAQPCDSFIFYEVPMTLTVCPKPWLAGDYSYESAAIVCEQPDANTGAPSHFSDFMRLQPEFHIHPDTVENGEKSWDPFKGMFFVRKHVHSKVHIGLWSKLVVEYGMLYATGQLELGIPSGEDYWGLKVTVIPV